jgi:hypothetical protein
VARADGRVVVEVVAVLLAIFLGSKDELGGRHIELFLHAESININTDWGDSLQRRGGLDVTCRVDSPSSS